MMEAYFGLRRLPFDRDIKSADLIASFDSREAEARLNHVKQYRGIMCLTVSTTSGPVEAGRC